MLHLCSRHSILQDPLASSSGMEKKSQPTSRAHTLMTWWLVFFGGGMARRRRLVVTMTVLTRRTDNPDSGIVQARPLRRLQDSRVSDCVRLPFAPRHADCFVKAIGRSSGNTWLDGSSR